MTRYRKQSTRVFTPEEVAAVKKLYGQGAGIKALCRMLKTSELALKRLFKENGLTFRPRGAIRAKTAPPRNARIVALRREGKTLKEIGITFGLSRQRVAEIVDIWSDRVPG